MNKIGVHALTFIGDIKNHSIEKCLSQVAKIGYDVMELPLLNPDALDTDFVSKTYEKFNIEPTVSLGLSFKTDIASEDEDRVNAGRELLFKALQKTIDVGSSNLCGVIHSALQKNDVPKTNKGYENSLSVIRDLAEEANKNNVTLSLEVVNRYETNIMNTAQDALNYINDLGVPNVKVHLDTYHMNIEENNYSEPIKLIGSTKLKSVLPINKISNRSVSNVGSKAANFGDAQPATCWPDRHPSICVRVAQLAWLCGSLRSHQWSNGASFPNGGRSGAADKSCRHGRKDGSRAWKHG